jgi:hypothetical protein
MLSLSFETAKTVSECPDPETFLAHLSPPTVQHDPEPILRLLTLKNF